MDQFIPRKIEINIRVALARDKSVLLFGAKQTGKTSLIIERLQPDISYDFAETAVRQCYEAEPDRLEKELLEKAKSYNKKPLVFIDAIHKIPAVMECVKKLINEGLAQFILVASSVRKLQNYFHSGQPFSEQVVSLSIAPLLFDEIIANKTSIEELLLYGSLPNIVHDNDLQSREAALNTYVSTYLEEEIRAESLVRDMGGFSRFLEAAAGEAAKPVNFLKLSQAIGVADSTIANYYQLLEEGQIAHRIDPITSGSGRRRLIKSPQYLFFDLGVRRAFANEGDRLPKSYLEHLFKHYVGNELICHTQITSPETQLRYWRDTAGPEVSYVLECGQEIIPVEVSWSDKPGRSEARHIKKMIAEYPVQKAYVICCTAESYPITDSVTALPWQQIGGLFQV